MLRIVSRKIIFFGKMQRGSSTSSELFELNMCASAMVKFEYDKFNNILTKNLKKYIYVYTSTCIPIP